MKKIFLISLISLFCTINYANARTTEMNNIEELRSKRAETKQVNIVPAKNIETVDDYKEYIRERFKKAEQADFDEGEDLTSMNSMNVQHSQEYIEKMKQEQKGTFEKIYDAALARLNSDNDSTRADVFDGGNTVFYRELNEREQRQIEAPDIPTVDVVLPTGKKILAPAAEHIPYMFTEIDIMPTGLIKIDETVIVVANGQKLANGLTRMLPKNSVSRDGTTHKINYEILNVSVNDQNIEHKLQKSGDNFLLKPKKDYILSPGVYTYKFSYLVDRQLWEYDDFNEFYWDITGSTWNLIISKVAALVHFYGSEPSLSQNVLIGYRDNISPYRAKIMRHDDNNLVFMATTPILIGEGMHVLLSLSKDNFITPDFNKRFEWFIEDYGDNLFALLGFLAIFISYALSWYYIKNDKTKTGATIKRTPYVLRFLFSGKFDKKSFGAIILDFMRRNIIDIEKNNDEIVLIKKTDNLKTLSRGEQKIIADLFANHDTTLNINNYNSLKIKRAYKTAEKSILSQMKTTFMKLNLSYLFFSVAMLLVTEVAIAYNNADFWQTIFILLSADVVFALYIWVMKFAFKNVVLRYVLRVFAVLLITFTVLLLSTYILRLAAILILLMVGTIFAYTGIFARRNGLLRTKIQDMIKYRTYLENHVKEISDGREFAINQPNIYALDLENEYSGVQNNKMQEINDILQFI